MTYFGFVFYLHINFKGNYSDSLRDAKDATDIRPLLVKAMVTGNCNVTLVSFRNSDRLTVIMSLRSKTRVRITRICDTAPLRISWFGFRKIFETEL